MQQPPEGAWPCDKSNDCDPTLCDSAPEVDQVFPPKGVLYFDDVANSLTLGRMRFIFFRPFLGRLACLTSRGSLFVLSRVSWLQTGFSVSSEGVKAIVRW